MLAEPVTETSSWLDVAARWSCRRSAVGRCDWYHGTWQYLRLLNLVSNPGWHRDYLLRVLAQRRPRSGTVRLLVSGCADYSAFAHAVEALGSRLSATVLDWCPTPLYATAWYARHRGVAPPVLVCEDAVEHRPVRAYDLVLSDSFLPRFAADAVRPLLQAWRQSLCPGGTAVTTVRIHGGPARTPTVKTALVDQWRRVAQESEPWWPSVSTLPHSELVERVAYFAEHQERNAVYDIDELIALFREAGFDEVECETALVNGKRFAHLAAAYGSQPKGYVNE